MKFVRPLVFAMVLAVLAGSLACNTFKGMGKDVEKGGEKIQKVAD
jgi:predicted small secreted protein